MHDGGWYSLRLATPSTISLATKSIVATKSTLGRISKYRVDCVGVERHALTKIFDEGQVRDASIARVKRKQENMW